MTGVITVSTRDRANFGWRREGGKKKLIALHFEHFESWLRSFNDLFSDVKQRIRAFTLIQAAADKPQSLLLSCY